MPLSVEELMKPRYRVIADYPHPPFTNDSYNADNEHIFIEGDLLIQCNVNGALTFKRCGRLGHMSVGVPCCAHPEKFPKIFQRLEWWEDRKVDEMPAYTKLESHFVHKVERWLETNYLGQPLYEYYNKVGQLTTFCAVDLQPATHADYQAYINHE
jgi:hypothetical protein